MVRISVKKGEMTTHQIVKTKFSQLNNKIFYFPNAIISLPFGHNSLEEIDTFKKGKGQRIEWCFLKEKEKLLELEKKTLKKCPRLNFLNNILLQRVKVVPIKTIKFDKETSFKDCHRLRLRCRMDEYREDYTFDGKFEGYILVVGRTGCGKTTFIQRIGKNKLFGRNLSEVF